jgi:hypothetical protein
VPFHIMSVTPLLLQVGIPRDALGFRGTKTSDREVSFEESPSSNEDDDVE